MKIALHDGFGGLQHTAEREFARRCVAVLKTLGHDPKVVTLSDEIVDFAPDLVLATHELVPKLTEHFTVGVLWSPRVFMHGDPERLRSIRSWDLAVAANAGLRQFAEDLYFPLRHKTAVANSILFPTAPVIPDMVPVDPRHLTLAYIGVHWDGGRHKELLLALSKLVDLHVYGPPGAWTFLSEHYRGVIPFDGKSLFATLNKHGAVLALHKDTHVGDDTPSMRPFEACASRCLVITDPMPTLQKLFGETLNYVDAAADQQMVALKIKDILRHARDEPETTLARISRAHDIFAANASLNELLTRLVEEVSLKIAAARIPIEVGNPTVTLIVRCGQAPMDAVRKAIDALTCQTYREICIVLSDIATGDDLIAYVESLKISRRFCDIAVVKAQYGSRSTALWAGIATARTEYVCILDLTDRIFPDHLSHAMQLFVEQPELDVVYTDVVGRVEVGVHAEQPARLKLNDGSLVQENRQLISQSIDDPAQLLQRDDTPTCGIVFRRAKLPAAALDDPHLDAFEIDYLLLMLLSADARCRWVGRVSAQTIVMTSEGPNDFTSRVHIDSIYRIRHRMQTFAKPMHLAETSLVCERSGGADTHGTCVTTATDSGVPNSEMTDLTASPSASRDRKRRRWLRFLRGDLPA